MNDNITPVQELASIALGIHKRLPEEQRIAYRLDDMAQVMLRYEQDNQGLAILLRGALLFFDGMIENGTLQPQKMILNVDNRKIRLSDFMARMRRATEKYIANIKEEQVSG